MKVALEELRASLNLEGYPGKDERDKAAVYMDGLSQMRSEWARAEKKKRRP